MSIAKVVGEGTKKTTTCGSRDFKKEKKEADFLNKCCVWTQTRTISKSLLSFFSLVLP